MNSDIGWSGTISLQLFTALRSALDFLAQLIKLVYRLPLLTRRALGSGKVVTLESLVKALDTKEPGGKLVQLLKATVSSNWYEYLNGLRIETIHVKPITIPKESSVSISTRFNLTVNVSVKKIDDRTGGVTEATSDSAQAEREGPPGETAVRIDKLLLPDEPWGNTTTKGIELVPWCETALDSVRDIIRQSYDLLICGLRGSK